MNNLAIFFLLVNAVALFILPRRWAPLVFLVCTCYMTESQVIHIGPFTFTVIRVLIAVGLARVIIRGERLAGGLNRMDWLMLIWSAWMLTSSVFHEYPLSALILRAGIIYSACGIYFIIRIFCQSLDDLIDLFRLTVILLVPLAFEMLYENMTNHNLYAVFGSPEIPEFREGRIRAQGPFSHSILAGTVGAVCLPLSIGLWQQHCKIAFAGVIACLSIVYTSGSSGPFLSAVASIAALFVYRYHQHTRLIFWLAVFGYIGLDLVMKAPAYYILARMGILDGSTAWHRAYLIESSFAHLHEWWLAGTDYTRHWMPTGVEWSTDHSDITNYYIKMGVLGGIPLMLLFIAILFKGFSFVEQIHRLVADIPQESRFFIWALGASLFVHAVSFISVSLYDQSVFFLYLTLAGISSVWSQNFS